MNLDTRQMRKGRHAGFKPADAAKRRRAASRGQAGCRRSRSATTVALVSTVGSTDMPGRSRPVRLWSSSTIFTGTRCTILVKLPVALSGGSSANSRPLAGARLSTWPLQPGAVEAVDRDFDRLAVAHMGELGLLEVRDHIDRVERHHRHQLRAGLHILADPQRARADGAVDRRDDLRVGQVQRRLLLRPRGRDRAARPPWRRSVVSTSIFLLRGNQAGFAVLQLRGLLAQRRVGLLRALHRAGAGLHQARRNGRCSCCANCRLASAAATSAVPLFDQRLLQRDLRVEVAHRGFGRRDIGLGLVERGPEIAVVDPRQQLSGLDLLVVADQHLGEIAGDLWRDDRGVGLDIGVVGRFQVAPGGADSRGRNPRHRRRRAPPASAERRALDRLPRRAQTGFYLYIRNIRKIRHDILLHAAPELGARDAARCSVRSACDNPRKTGSIVQ